MAKVDWDMRNKFAREYAASGNATQSAITAGCPATAAHSTGYKWAHHPDIIPLIRREIDGRLRDIAPVAIRVIEELMLSQDVPPQTRLSAARDMLDRAGLIPPKRAEHVDPLETKDLREMTRAELEAIVARAAAEYGTTDEEETV
jgi:hypothetical protein